MHHLQRYSCLLVLVPLGGGVRVRAVGVRVGCLVRCSSILIAQQLELTSSRSLLRSGLPARVLVEPPYFLRHNKQTNKQTNK